MSRKETLNDKKPADRRAIEGTPIGARANTVK